MGTKVEGKSYLPGYFAMRDPNFSSNGSWSLYYEEKTSSGRPDDWFMSGSASGYSEYDKETLKRTMLEHEAIFRKQVYELHRLYRIQKDLMEEFQKKELFRYPMSANTSNSNSFSSQMPCNGAKVNWQMPLFHTGYENTPTTQKNEIKSSLNFLKEGSVQSFPNGITKKMFDLRLPADAYIDNEEEERSLKKNKSIQLDNGNDIKLTLGSANGFNCRADSWVSDSLTENNHNNQKTADLNQTYCEGVADSTSTDFLGMKKFSTENHLHHSSTAWNASVLAFQRDLFKDKHVDEGSSSYFFDVNRKIRQGNSFITRENGKGTGTTNNFFTHNCFTPEPQRPSEPADMKLKRNHETLPTDRNNAIDWFRPKTTDHPNVSRSALPSYLNNYHIHQESFGDRYLEGVRSENAHPDGFRDGLTAQQDRTFCNLERRFEESAIAISWLRKKAACDEPVGLKNPQTVPNFLQGAAQEPNSKHGNESVVSIRPDINATSKPNWHIIERDEASEDASTRILGIPIYDKIKKSAIFLPISCQEQYPNVDKDTEKAWGKSGTTLRNLINLNDEYSEPLDVSPEIMVVNPPPASAASASVKSTFEIDLEAPLCLAEDDINPPRESLIAVNVANSQGKELQPDSFDIQVANNIIAMSMETKCLLERPSPCSDTLQWFAEIITLSAEHAEKSSNNEGLDLFESMTLKLQETKIDEYLCKPRALLDKNEDDGKASASASASLLFTKSRRGQARRRRQRRDFQKDILPGLASLSRHEVTEDLQIIGGLMKACGSSWEMGLMGRNGRNGSRARRQRRSLAVTVEEIRVSPPPPPPVLQPIIPDADEGRGIIGWGRTTRRCRRPRCPPGNSTAPLS